ncbi:MAG: efflux RND transporter periplasmic adaptor subunit [Candidatus Paceibacterota bacterium]
MIAKIKNFALRHKWLSLLLVLAIVFVSYWVTITISKGSTKEKYVFIQVKKDLLVSTISGSGQVAASNQVDLKSQASGQLVYLNALNGQELKTGEVIAKLDDSEAQKSIRDAQTGLESAQISYKKLIEPPDALSLMQAENNLAQAQEAAKTAQNNFTKAYEDGFANVAAAYIDYPVIMNGLNTMLFNSSYGVSGFDIDYYSDNIKYFDKSNKAEFYRSAARLASDSAKDSYAKSYDTYKSTSVFSEEEKIEQLISISYASSKKISEAVKGAAALIQLYKDTMVANKANVQALAETNLSSLNSYASKSSAHQSALLAAQTGLESAKASLENAKRSLAEKNQSLADLKAGATQLDKESSELSLKQKQDALLDAKEKLNDYYVRAPFAGVIAKVNVSKGDTLSSNASVVTFVTKQKIATIALNEVDAAKVKVGQKANITFSAINDLNVTGEVIEIDSIGTVSQGVVTYSAKIGFDVQDQRVKPGMSISAKIIIDSVTDALIVPSSAVKTTAGQKYVEMADEKIDANKATTGTGIELKNKTKKQNVETGLSNDSYIEIVNGLAEGDYVIIKSNSATSRTQTQNQNNQKSLFGGGGPMMR